MKEILYNKSSAVASLNRVEGFYPMELARRLQKEGQEDQLYLDVKYRKLWFRLVHPAGKVISYIRSFTENMALVEARVYLDKGDSEDSYIANSFSQKFRSEDPVFGDKFLEMAETAAIGRALSDAGFGLQFADVGEPDDPNQVDAGIPIPNGSIPAEGMKTLPANHTSVQEMPGVQNYRNPMPPIQQGSMMGQFYQQAQENGRLVGQQGMGQAPMNKAANQNLQSAMQGGSSQPEGTVPLDPGMPVEELVQRMTYEQAVQVVIPGNGKFGGKTMGQVAVENPQNLGWFAQSYSGNNHMVPAAARILIEKAMPLAG